MSESAASNGHGVNLKGLLNDKVKGVPVVVIAGVIFAVGYLWYRRSKSKAVPVSTVGASETGVSTDATATPWSATDATNSAGAGETIIERGPATTGTGKGKKAVSVKDGYYWGADHFHVYKVTGGILHHVTWNYWLAHGLKESDVNPYTSDLDRLKSGGELDANPPVSGNGHSGTVTPPPPSAPSSRTYIVHSGDTLSSIASHFYGNGNDWQRIYRANVGVIGGNPNVIKPGETLTIPGVTP